MARTEQAPSDPESIFSDPDTFVLHLTTTVLPSTGRPIQTTIGAQWRLSGTLGQDDGNGIELDKYAGHPESLDAPQWAKMLPAGQAIKFCESAEALTELLGRVAPWNFKDAMMVGSSVLRG